jgi:hypothetical protein
VPNTGIQFKKDPDFMAFFLVEAPGAEAPPPPPAKAGAPAPVAADTAIAKQVRAWLSRPIREALLDFPDAWLSVQGKTMALTLYGSVSADKLHELVAAADVIFAEHGAEGGPSLLGDGFEASDDEDDDDDESSDEAVAAPTAKSKPATKSEPATKSAAANKPAAKASSASKPAPAKAATVSSAAASKAASSAGEGPVKGTANKRI